MLEASHVCKSYGSHDVLHDVSLRLHPGERAGLVGRNGCGKSTLLRILAGDERPDSGSVRRGPASLLVGYLPQARDALGEQTVRDELRTPGLDGSRWWEAEEILRGLGFRPDQLEQRVASLSGGEKTRLGLAKLLLMQPDVMLLDEPTNHLDITMLEWLEDWLQGSRTAMLIVSHDRRFLDHTVQRIFELTDGELTAYTGNYSDYVRQKELALRRHVEAYREQQRDIKLIQEFIRRQLQMAARIQGGPKRGRDHYGRVASKVARRAQASRSRLEHMQQVERPRPEANVHVPFGEAGSSGQDVIVAENIGKQYGHTRLFTSFSITIRRGERIGIVGPNGAGKTTLLRLLLGREQPDTGTVRLGAGVVPGYIAQEHESLRFDRTILDDVRSAGEAGETEVRILLACLLFRGDEVFKRIDTLSDGERVRVALAKVLVAGANLLVLDEPTNHLDIPTRERIEAALESYDGTLLLVSHDRYLLDRLSEQTIVLGGGAATLYPGNYSYAAAKQRHRADASEGAPQRPRLGTVRS